MAAPVRRSADEHEADTVERAADAGFQLVQFETSNGQLVWEWQRGHEPYPQFVTRRVALNYMDDWLRRNTAHRHHPRIRRPSRS